MMERREFLAASAVLAGAAVTGCRISYESDAQAADAAGPLDAAAFARERRMVDTRYGRIAYVERGAGPAALFLHGFPLNGFQWRGALERLAPYRRCIAPDFMGLGYSEVPEHQDLSPAAQAEMLAAFCDALSLETLDVVANDSGTAIAQLFAVRNPERIRTLLLTNGDVDENCPPSALLPTIEAARAGVFADEVMARQVEDPEFARAGLGQIAYTHPSSLTDEAIAYYFAPLVSTPLRKAQLHQYTVAFEPNPLLAIRDALQRFSAPTLMLWGTGDVVFPITWAEWLDRTLPGSLGIRTVEGANLFFPEEMPDVIADAARSLWSV